MSGRASVCVFASAICQKLVAVLILPLRDDIQPVISLELEPDQPRVRDAVAVREPPRSGRPAASPSSSSGRNIASFQET